MSDVRDWIWPSTAGTLALGLSFLELRRYDSGLPWPATVLFLLVFVTSVAVVRVSPELGLAAGWAVGLVHLTTGAPLLLSESLLLLVVFGAARWGRTPTMVLAVVTSAVAPLLGLVWARDAGGDVGPAGTLLLSLSGYYDGGASVAAVLLAVLAAAEFPVLLGLALRFFARAQDAQRTRAVAVQDATQAQEIASLREQQNALARDVHDVVGHSLAVILAQAESAQFREAGREQELRETLATIASAARSSLRDVRGVLSGEADGATADQAALDELVAGVRRGGQEVVSSEEGAPQPLPPELALVAHRVLQEMLTNAIRHGRRDRPVRVERLWPDPGGAADSLRLEVTNLVAEGVPDAAPGQGLDGMRRRLASVGGLLDVRRREGVDGPEGPEGATFTATAWIPIRDRGAVSTHG